MKLILVTVGLAVLISNQPLYSQIMTPHGEIIEHLNDSSWIYNYKSVNDSSLSFFIVRRYNDRNMLESELQFNLIEGDSVIKSHRQYDYDENGVQLIETYQSGYDLKTMHFRSKVIFSNTSNRDVRNYHSYEWNGTNWILSVYGHSEWEGDNQVIDNSEYHTDGEIKVKYSYQVEFYEDSTIRYFSGYNFELSQLDSSLSKTYFDEFENVIKLSSYNWSGFWDPVNVILFELEYNDMNLITNSVRSDSYYDMLTNEWTEAINSRKEVSEFDSEGKVISKKQYNWISGSWHISDLEIHETNSTKTDSRSIHVSYNDDNLLTYGTMWHSTYNEDARISDIEHYYLSAPDSIWKGGTKLSYYYTSGIETSVATYNWSEENSKWEDLPGSINYSDYNVFTADSLTFVGCDNSRAYTDTTYYSTDTTKYSYFEPIVMLDDIIVSNDSMIVAYILESSYHWISCASGDTLQSSSKPYFVPSEPGTYYCSVKGEDCSIETSCILSSVLGIDTDVAVFIYPNPTQESVFIKLKESQTFQFVLYSERGEVILAQEGKASGQEIDLSNLTQGIYILNITSSTYSEVHKIIKK